VRLDGLAGLSDAALAVVGRAPLSLLELLCKSGADLRSETCVDVAATGWITESDACSYRGLPLHLAAMMLADFDESVMQALTALGYGFTAADVADHFHTLITARPTTIERAVRCAVRQGVAVREFSPRVESFLFHAVVVRISLSVPVCLTPPCRERNR
jgi:hypothetical protein